MNFCKYWGHNYISFYSFSFSIVSTFFLTKAFSLEYFMSNIFFNKKQQYSLLTKLLYFYLGCNCLYTRYFSQKSYKSISCVDFFFLFSILEIKSSELLENFSNHSLEYLFSCYIVVQNVITVGDLHITLAVYI